MTQVQAPVKRNDWLTDFPAASFGMIMGLAGTAMVLNSLHMYLRFPPLGYILFWTALSIGALFLGIYIAKMVFRFESVRHEFTNPMSLPMVAAISVSFLLLGASGKEVWPTGAAFLWWVGVILQTFITFGVLYSWLAMPIKIEQISPSWFVPVVGNIIVPLAGPTIVPPALGWFYASAGLIMWLALHSIVFQRLFIATPLPPQMLPAVAIAYAPPAVGSLCLLNLHPVAPQVIISIMTYGALFIALVVGWYLFMSAGKIKFSMSLWALTLPTAALSNALFRLPNAQMRPVAASVAVFLLGLVTALFLRTVFAFIRGDQLNPAGAPRRWGGHSPTAAKATKAKGEASSRIGGSQEEDAELEEIVLEANEIEEEYLPTLAAEVVAETVARPAKASPLPQVNEPATAKPKFDPFDFGQSTPAHKPKSGDSLPWEEQQDSAGYRPLFKRREAGPIDWSQYGVNDK